MLLIGLTGSIGMGKSTAAERFRHHDVPVIDADEIVHELYIGEAVKPVDAAFPGVAVGGQIDRAKLSAQLLAKPERFKILEAVIHPLVQAAEKRALLVAKEAGATMVVLEIPLLFETKGEKKVDVTVVVSAPLTVQRTRVLSRSGMTAEKLDAILHRQMPDSEKRKRAEFVVDTGGDIAATHMQIDAIVVSLRGRSASAYAQFWA